MDETTEKSDSTSMIDAENKNSTTDYPEEDADLNTYQNELQNENSSVVGKEDEDMEPLEFQEESNTSELNKYDDTTIEGHAEDEFLNDDTEETSNIEDVPEEINKKIEVEIRNNDNYKSSEVGNVEIDKENKSISSESVNFQEENESQSLPSNENDQTGLETTNVENLPKDDREISNDDRDNLLNIEEVDAHVSINKNNHDDEEDVLSDDRTQTTEKQKSPQQPQADVECEELDNNKVRTNEDTLEDKSKASDMQDIEMRSVESNDVCEKEKSVEPSENEKCGSIEKEKGLEAFSSISKPADLDSVEEPRDSEFDKDNESQDYDKDEAISDNLIEHQTEMDQTHDNQVQTENVDPADNDTEINESQTENVQEETQGESADVCLIPDNDEELTGAEKEQAILARKNAEKEDAEKEQEDNETEVTTNQDKKSDEKKDLQEPVKDYTVESDLTVEIDNEDEFSVLTKLQIVSIIHINNECAVCKEDKSCEFRYKDEEDQYIYICSKNCCDDLVSKEETRFCVRKREYIVENLAESITEFCVVCKEQTRCKFNFKQDDDILYICSDNCYNVLTKNEPGKLKLKQNSIRVKNLSSATPVGIVKPTLSETKILARTPQEAEIAKLDREASFERRCANCGLLIHATMENLSWETLDFCNQLCLSKHQHAIGEKCRICTRPVSPASLGKYCVRFGFEICQFCCAACLDKYKKSLKNCSFCQKDISKTNEGFLAPVGDNEQFKDFCSQNCMKKFDASINPKTKTKLEQCSVCNNKKILQVELILDERNINFCSNPCFSAFKFVNNILPDKCNFCFKYFERKAIGNYTVYSDNNPQVFCGRVCLNMFITQNRKIVFCQWCKVKKYNFDMIEKQLNSKEKVTMCSLNCLVLHGVSLKRSAKQKLKCDHCLCEKPAQYHLTMSDTSMRNFCTYQCVMQFQSQFSNAPLTLDSEKKNQKEFNIAQGGTRNNSPFPTGLPKRIKSNLSSAQNLQVPLAASQSTMPIIANITSLASESSTRKRNRIRSKNSIDTIYSPTMPQIKHNISQNRLYDGKTNQSKTLYSTPKIKVPKKTIGTTTMEPANKTFVIELPSDAKLKFNINTQCGPITETRGITCKPESRDSEIQTDNDVKSKKLIPIPIPIYIPQPMQGYPIPRPIPIPFAFPIPVPIFIPTTKNSAQGIMKEIKKIQDKMPADPYEAELLMMAELVASDKKKEESDDENNDVEYSNDNSYGEDVLQMALKMATEYDEPSVDLDSTMTSNNISQSSDNDNSNLIYHQMQLNQRSNSNRTKKRSNPANVTTENNIQPVIKKRRPSENAVVIPNQNLPLEKPDANMCLKYTFGVNAWKQWVLTKNAEIEKSSIRRKPFKSELLQMTADELNYSLCLFVKEVRKPNGTEYAPDTIYYLVLGIQQYLYENGRIDNIFTDPYYERFTDCLDEVARKFSILYNDSQYIVTRVEEEHLWECKQLGAHSPHVLLSTLMFFNTKHFNLTNVEEHMQLSFSHIMKHWKRNSQGAKQPGSRNVLLRFYPPNGGQGDSKKKKVYEQQENESNPLRCPVRLYEFYLSKCPESVKTRNDVFYLQPERSCVPDSPVWYSTQPLSQESLQKMLHRVKMVKEINVALLTI